MKITPKRFFKTEEGGGQDGLEEAQLPAQIDTVILL